MKCKPTRVLTDMKEAMALHGARSPGHQEVQSIQVGGVRQLGGKGSWTEGVVAGTVNCRQEAIVEQAQVVQNAGRSEGCGGVSPIPGRRTTR